MKCAVKVYASGITSPPGLFISARWMACGPARFPWPARRDVYPVSLKGRAWIAADSGEVMHLETNLVKGDSHH